MATPILSDLLEYDPSEKTCLRWKVGVFAGKHAGSQRSVGSYYRVAIQRKRFYVHRIVWELHHGPIPIGMQIDHIDGDPTNNRIENLRVASASENLMNARIGSDNTSGVKGLSWNRSLCLWHGYLWVDGKRVSKYSKSKDIVSDWLHKKRIELHGEYARYE